MSAHASRMEYPVTLPLTLSAVFLCACSLLFWYRTSTPTSPATCRSDCSARSNSPTLALVAASCA